MNIIEAIKQAESGKLITNNVLKIKNHFLKYIKNGIFYEYKIVNDKTEYKYEVRQFLVAEIISEDWEILDKNYFEN